jgi:hypothetical protein
MPDKDPFRYLTSSLREVAWHHLNPDEQIVKSIYIPYHSYDALDKSSWFKRTKQVQLPARAFVLTTERILILEDPDDPVTTTMHREYLVASCPLSDIIYFEMRSHLLDCALTLVTATPKGPTRVTVEYGGIREEAFLRAVAYMRTQIDCLPLPSYARSDEVYAQKRKAALKQWHQMLRELEMKQENAITRFLDSGEQVQEWLLLPSMNEGKKWQRPGIYIQEHPPAIIVRTDRQILLLKEMQRIIRGVTTHGSDAWLLPLSTLKTASMINDAHRPELQISLARAEVTDVVHLTIPPELAEQALACVTSPLATSGK